MSRLTDALKKFSKKCSKSEKVPTGRTAAALIDSIATNFDIEGAPGEDGAYVTAIALTTTEGAVTGGTATLSNGDTVEITVTTGT